jgi:hypothetical protein
MNHIMSLYDKYHSQHNKTYMYNLVSSLLAKEHACDVTSNEMYNQFFETNFQKTFQVVDTEELTDLNKHLLNTQIDYYDNLLSKQMPSDKLGAGRAILDKVTQDEPEEPDEPKTLEEPEEEHGHYMVHSLQRIINFHNSHRHTYKVYHTLKDKRCQIEKVIIPIEESYLFANPILILSVDGQPQQLHLRGTMKLGEREYGIYSPFFESVCTLLSDKSVISLTNQLSSVSQPCDIYKVNSCENGSLHIAVKDESEPRRDFKVGDYVRLCNFGNIDLSEETDLKRPYKIRSIHDNILSLDEPIDADPGLYVMNLSLQNTIHMSYS